MSESPTTTSSPAVSSEQPSTSDAWGSEQPTTEATESKESTTPEDKPKESPTKKAKKWLTAKINGKEERVDEETLLRDYQKYKAADERFSKASQAEKSVQNFLEALQKDPAKVLNNPNLPIDRRKLAEDWLYAEIQKELNPPDPKDHKLSELEKELSQYKEKEELSKKQAEQEEYQKVVSKRKEELGSLFSKAMENSPLAKSQETSAATLREMALYYRAYKEHHGEEPSAEELASHVEQKYYKGLYSLANTLEGEDLVKFLGEGLVKKIRQYDLQRLKGGQEPTKPQAKSDDWGSVRNAPAKKTMSPLDAREHARKMLFGK